MPFKSSKKSLISIGIRTLNRKLPLPQALVSLDSGDVGLELLDKLLNELPDVWSKKDRRTWFKNAVKHNTAISCKKELPHDVKRSLDILEKRHRVKAVSTEFWKPDFFNKNASIWFLEDKVLESLIFSVTGEWELEPVIVDIPEVGAIADVWERPYLEAMAGLSDGSIRRAEVLLACRTHYIGCN